MVVPAITYYVDGVSQFRRTEQRQSLIDGIEESRLPMWLRLR